MISFAESENVDVVVTVDAIIGPVVAAGLAVGMSLGSAPKSSNSREEESQVG